MLGIFSIFIAEAVPKQINYLQHCFGSFFAEDF